jgi:hypothetical protein
MPTTEPALKQTHLNRVPLERGIIQALPPRKRQIALNVITPTPPIINRWLCSLKCGF